MPADAGGLSWNLAADLQGVLAYHFMVNAFLAGAVVAVLAGLVGWFMVLRRESFVGHTLAVTGFPGAAGATLVGISAVYGFFAFCVAGALIITALPRRRGLHSFSEESAVVGTVQASALACGVLFVSLYRGFLNSVNAFLFGSFLGITDSQVLVLLVVAALAAVTLAVIGRPLLFLSVDADVAAASGVPARPLTAAFLILLGLAAAAVSQITGTLLVFALLVVPPATAQLLTARPFFSLMLAVLLGLAITWLGLAIAYYSPYPVGFFITTLAFASYLAARTWRAGLAPHFGRPAAARGAA
ncbi:MAG TPA: iron chelate uptake ABC transporter family permease subunit [Dehalococcoidia bacterium]|nr:iron chelate uptake ABC transporter family permease subunit [Dehalococcoidia bacterium]